MNEMTEQGRAARNAYHRKYRKLRREKEKAYLKSWRKAHPEKIRDYNKKYWERVAEKANVTINNSSVTISVTSPVSVTTQCKFCGKEFKAKRSTAKFCSPTCRVNYNRVTKITK